VEVSLAGERRVLLAVERRGSLAPVVWAEMADAALGGGK